MHGVGFVPLQAAGRTGKADFLRAQQDLAKRRKRVTPKIMMTTEMRRPAFLAA